MAIESIKETEQNTKSAMLSRRVFLVNATATGTLVLMAKVTAGEVVVSRASDLQDDDFSPDLFVSISRSGDVTIMAHRSEMGTGIRTTLPRIVADEMDADWNRVTVKQAPGDKRYGSQNTDGSNSVLGFFDRMRTAGATVRTMLEQAAAKQWGVPVEQVHADLHKVVDSKTNKSVSYGDLVAVATTLEVPKAADVKFKPREKWRYIGKASPSVDLDDIVTGKAIFGVDAKMEGQVYAIIRRPRVFGGKVKSVDSAKVKKMPGVIDVIEIPKFRGPAPAFQPLGGVAVVAETTWQAWQGRDALKVVWDHGPNETYDTTEFKKTLKKSANADGKVIRESGDVEKALESATKKFAVDYSVPHLAHASMEVPAAVADVKTDSNGKAISCRMLAATQNPQAVQAVVGQAIGMKPDDVVVEVTLLGSGFGRKSKPDYCAEAAMLSMQVGRPVHVIFTREDDIRNDYYHTMSAMHLEAATDEAGMPTAWLHRAAYPPIGSTFNPAAKHPGPGENSQGLADVPFEIPNIQIETGPAEGHVRIGWLRAVCHIQQNFATSSFADELAHHAGRNPKDYLLELLGTDRELKAKGLKADEKFPYDIARLKNVLRTVAELSEWDKRYQSMPKGSGMGIACARSFSSYAAHVFEVVVSQEGKLTVNKVWVVLDAGTVISPDRVTAQMEGSIAMTMGQTLFGKITFAKGRCEQSNYDDYKMVTMENYPREIVTEIVESTEAPAGVGESTVASAAPALCNAIFAATGKRIRDLPVADHELSWG